MVRERLPKQRLPRGNERGQGADKLYCRSPRCAPRNADGQAKGNAEKFDDCYAELTEINERELFVYDFRLGMRIAIESLSNSIS